MTTCVACQKDEARFQPSRWRKEWFHESRLICRRVRSKTPQWYEREPGEWRQHITAELTRQSKRLARQPDITFAEAA